jgi:hypothetical protein
MEYCLAVFENKLDDFIKIMINERYEKGPGTLFLNFISKEKLDVYYISIYDKENDCINEQFPSKFYDYYSEKIRDCPSSLVYFYVCNEEKGVHIELDLDKKSGYVKKLVDNGILQDKNSE